MSFTKRKFIDFPHKMQHKKCSELLRQIYDELLSNGTTDEILHHYNELQVWMKEPPIEETTLPKIADRFHWHLNQARLSLHEENLLPTVRKGDLSHHQTPWPIAIYLDHLRSAHNVGSILRTVEAFSLGSVYFSQDTPNHTHPQVIKTSMGTSEWVKCDATTNLSLLPRPIIAVETSPSAQSIYSYPFPETFTLVLGNEEYGCSKESLSIADVIVEIPLRGRKNSLNVANAFAVVATEIARQREKCHG